MKPDYAGGGFVNLIASLSAACGAPARHREAALLPAAEAAAARNVVLALFDGVGDNYLCAHGAGGALARRRRGAISAVFPSTTASAITTSFTGATPLEHGLTGWFTFFGEAGCVAAPLPFCRRGEKGPLRIAPETIFSERSLFDRLAVRPIVVSSREFIDSPYNRHHCGGAERCAYADLRGFVDEIVAAVKSGPERKFVYAYWPAFDTLAHRHGVASGEARGEFERIDAAFGELLRRLAGTGTLVVATADHGLVDSVGEDSIELPATLAGLLRYPLCGERRTAFCHVHEPDRFARLARDFFGERAEVRPSRELAEQGWFGPGRPHPRLAERIGDVALLMQGRATVKDWVPGEPRHLHVGNHGGTSEDEMKIPLIVESA